MSDSKAIRTELLRLYSYNPETGVFSRIKSTKGGRAGPVSNKPSVYGYLMLRVLERLSLQHRLAWLYVYGEWPKGEIDHINGDKLDNRIANLRDVDRATNSQNQRGARKTNKLGAMGVVKVNNRFRARLNVDNETMHIGYFDSEEDANAAYLKEKRKHHQGCTI